MVTVTQQLVSGKKVLLRYDLDVPIQAGVVTEDYRLLAGLETLDLCLQYASSVIILGHVGRPTPLRQGFVEQGGEDPAFSVKPIVDWFEKEFAHVNLPSGKLHILENLRFEEGEDNMDTNFAKELAQYGDFFINEAFAAHHPSTSTVLLPKMMPHAAGLRFTAEVEKLDKIRHNPERPLIAIIGGVKLEDKLPAIQALAKVADKVLVGGKIALDIKLSEHALNLPENVLLGRLNDTLSDIDSSTVTLWKGLIAQAKEVLWNGPLGKIEDPSCDKSKQIAQAIIDSQAESIVGGGDTIKALDKWEMLNKFSFVSTGGGAMLEYLIKGTLPSIEALE